MNQKQKIDQIFNDCLDRLFKGQSIEQILADYPDQAGELEPLLRTAAATRAFSKIEPRVDFKSRARYEFMTAAQDLEKRSPKRSFLKWRWQPAWAIGLASVLGVFLLGGGTVAASTGSMPGQALYSVKLAAEQVHLALTFSDLGKTELNAEFATRRSQEIEYLATAGDTEQIQMATARLNTSLSNMSALAQEDARDSNATSGEQPPELQFNAASTPADKNTQTMMAVPAATDGFGQAAPDETPVPATTGVVGVQPSKAIAPPPSVVIAPQPAAVPPQTASVPQASGGGASDSANNMTSESASNGSSLRGQGNNLTAGNSKTLSKREKMRKIIEDNYQTRKATLEAALEKADPDLKPAIRQAIADSESEYLKSIQNLDMGLYNSNQNLSPGNNQTSNQNNPTPK